MLIQPILAFVHEMGHAIPALLFTEGKVTIYIGSYGEKNNSFKANFGRLHIFIKRRYFFFGKGMCTYEKGTMSFAQQVIYIIGGVTFSILIALLATVLALSLDVHGSIKIICVGVLFATFLELIINFYPIERNDYKSKEGDVFNDGLYLKEVIVWKIKHSKLHQDYQNQKYDSIIQSYKNNESKHKEDLEVKRLAFYAYLLSDQLENAVSIADSYLDNENYHEIDLTSFGLAYSRLNHREKAMNCYNLALKNNPDNETALNNRGYEYNLSGEYDKAIADFNQILESDFENAHALSNRGLAKVKTNQPDAMEELQRAIVADPINAYVYKHIGIYYYDKTDYETALSNFEKAKQMDNTVHEIDQDIANAKSKIGKLNQ